MVPASGSLEAKSEADEQGYVTTYKLSVYNIENLLKSNRKFEI